MDLVSLVSKSLEFLAGATSGSFIKGYFTKWGQEKYSQRQQAQEKEYSTRQQEESASKKNIENICFVIAYSSLVYSGLVIVLEPNEPKRLIHSGTGLGITLAVSAVTPKKKNTQ